MGNGMKANGRRFPGTLWTFISTGEMGWHFSDLDHRGIFSLEADGLTCECSRLHLHWPVRIYVCNIPMPDWPSVIRPVLPNNLLICLAREHTVPFWGSLNCKVQAYYAVFLDWRCREEDIWARKMACPLLIGVSSRAWPLISAKSVLRCSLSDAVALWKSVLRLSKTVPLTFFYYWFFYKVKILCNKEWFY